MPKLGLCHGVMGSGNLSGLGEARHKLVTGGTFHSDCKVIYNSLRIKFSGVGDV